jgi:hypothetical protein
MRATATESPSSAGTGGRPRRRNTERSLDGVFEARVQPATVPLVQLTGHGGDWSKEFLGRSSARRQDVPFAVGDVLGVPRWAPCGAALPNDGSVESTLLEMQEEQRRSGSPQPERAPMRLCTHRLAAYFWSARKVVMASSRSRRAVASSLASSDPRSWVASVPVTAHKGHKSCKS